MNLYFYVKKVDVEGFYQLYIHPYCKIDIIPRIGEQIKHENELFVVENIVHDINKYSVAINCYLSPFKKETEVKKESLLKPINLVGGLS